MRLIQNEDRIERDKGQQYLDNLYAGHDKSFYNSLRMTKFTFSKLVATLHTRHGLCRNTPTIEVEKFVAIFIQILAFKDGNKWVQHYFGYNGSAISNKFYQVLASVVDMARVLLLPSDRDLHGMSLKIANDARYRRYFGNCIGAIDGIHVPISAPVAKQRMYTSRRRGTTMNNLVICNFDMMLTFSYVGMAGMQSDAYMLHVCKGYDDFPKPPSGKYYLVDWRFTNRIGYLAPYPQVRYRMSEFRRYGGPQGPKENFNYLHSSLRSVIERSFGILKKKWRILEQVPSYSLEVQRDIILATMTLYNFIRREGNTDCDIEKIEHNEEFTVYDTDDESCSSRSLSESEIDYSSDEEERPEMVQRRVETSEMDAFRDCLAEQMWRDREV